MSAQDLTNNPSLDEEDDEDDEEDDEDYIPDENEAGSSPDLRPFWAHHFVPRISSDYCISSAVSEESGEGEDEEDLDDKPSKKMKTEQLDDKPKELSQEEEKKRADDLWAMFNDDQPETKPKPTTTVSTIVKSEEKRSETSSTSVPTSSSIFDDVVEEPKVKGEPVAEPLPKKEPLQSKPIVHPKKTGGLSSLVSRLGNKQKESTLNKSKEDWQKFKESEGLVEELTEHTKSKDSFVERQAFLQRADLRQFEQERSIRDKMRARKLP